MKAMVKYNRLRTGTCGSSTPSWLFVITIEDLLEKR